MVRILLVAALVSLVLSFVKQDFVETLGIIAAIILATTVGFYFECDAARRFSILTQMGEEQSVKVMRDGRLQEIPRREIVVGDIVIVGWERGVSERLIAEKLDGDGRQRLLSGNGSGRRDGDRPCSPSGN